MNTADNTDNTENTITNGNHTAPQDPRTERVDRAAQLITLGQRIMGTLERDQALQAAQHAARQLIAADGVSAALHATDAPTLYLYLTGEGRPTVLEFPYEETALRFVCNSGESLTLDDISESEYPDYKVLVRHAPLDVWEEGQTMRAALIVPMRVADRVIGTFNLTSTTAAVFDSDDLALAEQLATFLAVALENARMYAQAADRVSIEQLSSQLTGQQQGDIQALFLNTLREVGETLNARVGRIRLQMPTVEAVDVAKLRKLFDSGTFGKRFKLADMVKPETDPHHPHLQKPAPGESGTPSEQG